MCLVIVQALLEQLTMLFDSNQLPMVNRTDRPNAGSRRRSHASGSADQSGTRLSDGFPASQFARPKRGVPDWSAGTTGEVTAPAARFARSARKKGRGGAVRPGCCTQIEKTVIHAAGLGDAKPWTGRTRLV